MDRLPKILIRPFLFTIAKINNLAKRRSLIFIHFYWRESPLPKLWLFIYLVFLGMGHLQYSIAKFYGNCNPINHNFPGNVFKENVIRLDNMAFIMLSCLLSITFWSKFGMAINEGIVSKCKNLYYEFIDFVGFLPTTTVKLVLKEGFANICVCKLKNLAFSNFITIIESKYLLTHVSVLRDISLLFLSLNFL